MVGEGLCLRPGQDAPQQGGPQSAPGSELVHTWVTGGAFFNP